MFSSPIRLALFVGVTFAVASSAAEPAPPLPPPPPGFALKGDAKAGKLVYEKNCLMCHGTTGVGDGPAGAALTPKPFNFTDAAAMAKVTDWELFLAVSDGGLAVHKSPLMPSWKATLKEKDVHDVLFYVKSLTPKKK